ncbi:cytochrome P450 71A1-like [Momordica charantia]|uniref:Cytochrome P450 71A1-like n=1 Tax=Momordica charantia TaxID=3673 RepID=A0A6J1C7Y2_MOMCH|nr:cytochrome P450 71A1-like [Momordica charantia]
MFLKLGHIPTLVISSSKLAREIIKSHDITFSNRLQITAANILLYGCHDVGFAPYGEYWREARKFCVMELLSAKRVESFQHVRDEEVALLVKRVHKACIEDNDSSSSSVNLNRLLLSTSNNIVSRCVLGEKFEDENGKSRFGEVSRRVMVLMAGFCVADFFPGFRWIDVLRGFIGELKSTFQTLDAFFDEVIEKHREKMMRTDDHQSDVKDFVDIMLQLQRDEALDYCFSRDNIKAILLDMLVGGTETTAIGLEWTMAELTRNPQAMKKVQEEIRRIVGKKTKIEMEDTKKMEYMNCVIKESLRLHPLAPLLVPRETSGIVTLEESYQIPSKTSIWINAWAIQRDPETWESPNEFIPERFMEKNSVDFKGQDFEFIPFGSGRRKCPAISFGLASFEYVLANLLYWFDWKLPEEMAGELDISEEHGLTVRKKIPLHLNPIPYTM